MTAFIIGSMVVVGLVWLFLVPRADESFGTALTFSSGFFAEVQSVSLSGYERGVIETTHMTSTSGWRTFQASDLKSPGQITVALSFRPNDDIPITSAAATLTVTFPVASGLSTGATLAVSAFLVSFEVTAVMDQRMEATAVLQLSGQPTWTDGA